MATEAGDRVELKQPQERCVVCLKRLGADEQRWPVHFRGSRHVVCCPSCVHEFDRAPRQFIEPA